MISIITCVYNDAENLKKCIESVISQTYKKFEVLIVDDGSTDKSLQVCESYQKKHNNFHVYHITTTI